MEYGLNDKPPFSSILLYGLQWFIVTLPSAVITGVIVTNLHGYGSTEQHAYLQVLLVAVGLTTVAQILWGHRLPLILGPASTLLIGIVATLSHSTAQIYTAIAMGGLTISLLSASGILKKVHAVFTPRVIIVILILVAVNLVPVILNLVLSDGGGIANILFCLCFAFGLAVLNATLKGVWKSTTLVWGIVAGTLLYLFWTGLPFLTEPVTTSLPSFAFIDFEFDSGVIIAFLFCYLGLLINELGSIEAVGYFLEADNMAKRVQRGVVGIGLSNMVSGGLGVIGFVDFSMSSGIIAATRCASRYTLLPTGGLLVLCAFVPGVIDVLTALPTVVMGSLLLYIMSTQLVAGFSMLNKERCLENFNEGLVIALPVMVALLTNIVPQPVLAQAPQALQSIIGNGFVMGVVFVLIMEHGLLHIDKLLSKAP